MVLQRVAALTNPFWAKDFLFGLAKRGFPEIGFHTTSEFTKN